MIPTVLAASFIDSPGLSSGTALLYAGGAVGMFIWSKKIKDKAVSDTRKKLHYIAMGLAGALFLVNVGSMFVNMSGYTPILGIGLAAVGIIIYYDSRKEKKEEKESTGDKEAQAEDKIEELAVGGGDASGMKGGKKLEHIAKDMEKTDEKKEELEEEIAKDFEEEGGVPEEIVEKEEEMEEVEEEAAEELIEEQAVEDIVEGAVGTKGGVSEHKAKSLEKSLRKAIINQHKDAIKRIDKDITLNKEEIDALKAAVGFKHVSDKDKAKFEKEIKKLEKENEEFKKMQDIEKEEEKEYNKLIKKEEDISKIKQKKIEPLQVEKEDLLKQYKDLQKEMKKSLKEISKGDDETVNIANLHVELKRRKKLAKAIHDKIKNLDTQIKDIKKGDIDAAEEVAKAAPGDETAEAQAEATGEVRPGAALGTTPEEEEIRKEKTKKERTCLKCKKKFISYYGKRLCPDCY